MRLLGIALVALLMAGPMGDVKAADRSIVVVPLPDQEEIFEQGQPWYTSGGDALVSVNVAADGRKHAWLTLVVVNRSERPLTIREEDISVSLQGSPLHVSTYAELMKAEKRKQFWEQFAAGLAAAANSYSAAQQGSYTQYGSFQGNVNSYGAAGGYSSATINGTYSATGVDPAVAQAANAQAQAENQRMMAIVAARQAVRSAALSGELFKSQTIPPGASYAGKIRFDLPRTARATSELLLAVRGESGLHEFHVFVDGPPTAERVSALRNERHNDSAADPRMQAVAAAVSPESPSLSPEPVAPPVPDATAVAAAEPQHEPAYPPVTHPQIAVRTEPPPIRVTLVGKRAAKCPKGEGDCVFVDLGWQVNTSRRITHIEGDLTMSSLAGGTPLTVEWVVDNPTGEPSFVQRGVGFPLAKTGKSADWLTHDAPTAIWVEFRPVTVTFAD